MTASTYRSRDDERDDRRQQENLLAALDAAPSQLRRDECGWWIIGGRHGVINTWGDGETWMAVVTSRSPRHWTAVKHRLAFMTVTQDGDDEGCLRLFYLPSPQEAVAIRDALGLRKRRTLTEASRARLIAAGVNRRFRGRTAATAPGLVSDPHPVPCADKIAPIATIDAADAAPASMARAGLARGAASAPIADDDLLPEIGGRFSPEAGLVVEHDAILDVEEECA